jgi:hypothetical protein
MMPISDMGYKYMKKGNTTKTLLRAVLHIGITIKFHKHSCANKAISFIIIVQIHF